MHENEGSGPGPGQDAEVFARRFAAVYLRFHRRDGPRSGLGGAARGVLGHLALSGPLTVGEAAAHLSRAQSVVSEIVAHLERKGLLERESDPADRRRTLVWLTPEGHEALRRDREVLSGDLLTQAMARMTTEQRAALLDGLAALMAADDALPAGLAGHPADPAEHSTDHAAHHPADHRERP
jgi:DNA-binding MarR family transcriptional regulator